jgi:predicted secreted protein
MITRVLISFIFVGFSISCSDLGTQPVFDASINGKSLTLFSEQRFTLELDVQADAGYQWQAQMSDSTVLKLDSTAYRPKNAGPIMPGGPTVEIFFFCAGNSGKCTVTLSERHLWLPNDPPRVTLAFIVIVR